MMHPSSCFGCCSGNNLQYFDFRGRSIIFVFEYSSIKMIVIDNLQAKTIDNQVLANINKDAEISAFLFTFAGQTVSGIETESLKRKPFVLMGSNAMSGKNAVVIGKSIKI
jgi:hypothetical protein